MRRSASTIPCSTPFAKSGRVGNQRLSVRILDFRTIASVRSGSSRTVVFAACFRYGCSSRNPRAPPKDSFARSSGRSGRAVKVEFGRACGGPGGDAPRTLSPGQEHQTEEAERSSGVRGVGASSRSPAVFTAPFCSAALRSPFCGRAPHGKPAPLAVLAKPLYHGRFNDERFRPSVGPLKLVLFRAARCGRSGNRACSRTRTRPPEAGLYSVRRSTASTRSPQRTTRALRRPAGVIAIQAANASEVTPIEGC